MKREQVPERAQLPSLRLEGLINQLLRTLTVPLPAAPGHVAQKCCPVRRRPNVLRTYTHPF